MPAARTAGIAFRNVSLVYRAACFLACSGCSSNFWMRQVMISATNSVFSFGHAISWIQPN